MYIQLYDGIYTLSYKIALSNIIIIHCKVLLPGMQCEPTYVLFPGDYLSVISCYYQVLVEVPPTTAVCLDQPPMRINSVGA